MKYLRKYLKVNKLIKSKIKNKNNFKHYLQKFNK